MNDSLFVDTNILVYYRDSSDPEKQKIAEDWMTEIWKNKLGRISYQVLNEYYVTVTRKLDPGLQPQAARLDIKNLMEWDPVVVDKKLIENGWIIQDQYKFSWWDSLIIAAAQKANCSILLSEDLQHRQKIENLTIIDPFKTGIDSIIQSEDSSK